MSVPLWPDPRPTTDHASGPDEAYRHHLRLNESKSCGIAATRRLAQEASTASGGWSDWQSSCGRSRTSSSGRAAQTLHVAGRWAGLLRGSTWESVRPPRHRYAPAWWRSGSAGCFWHGVHRDRGPGGHGTGAARSRRALLCWLAPAARCRAAHPHVAGLLAPGAARGGRGRRRRADRTRARTSGCRPVRDERRAYIQVVPVWERRAGRRRVFDVVKSLARRAAGRSAAGITDAHAGMEAKQALRLCPLPNRQQPRPVRVTVHRSRQRRCPWRGGRPISAYLRTHTNQKPKSLRVVE